MAGEFDGLVERMRAMRGEEAEPAAAAPEPAPEPEHDDPIRATEDDGMDAGDDGGLLADDQQGDPEPQEEPLSVSTLDDISEALGVPVSDLYDISVPMSMDGQRVDVKLGDWKDNYQSAQRLSAKEQEVQSRAQQAALASQQWQETLQKAAASEQALAAMLEADENSIDWKALREDDPTEYVAKRQEFQERKAKVEAARSELQGQWQQTMASQERQNALQRAEAVEHERMRLMRALPSWKDEAVAAKERTKIAKFLSDTGFSSEEIAGVADHRAILIARAAMLYSEAQGRAKTGKKTTKPRVPTIKPSGRAPRNSAGQEKTEQLRGRLKKSGRLQDAVALRRAARSKG